MNFPRAAIVGISLTCGLRWLAVRLEGRPACVLESRPGANAISVAANLERIKERVALAADRSDRDAADVTLIAVSKTFAAEAVREAYAAGLRRFGESRIQESEAKRAELVDLHATWHFIGHLQSNKARRAVELFDRVDSVDSMSIAQRLNDAAAAESKRLRVLLEVNLGGEASKTGIAGTGLPALAEGVAAMPNLEPLGLMTVPPFSEDPLETRGYFRRLRELRDDLSEELDWPLPVLSMGMSQDFEIAIEEGATEIRLGTALFGDRPRA
jgi:pyridoxal phosphate enzyme (YggS family)